MSVEVEAPLLSMVALSSRSLLGVSAAWWGSTGLGTPPAAHHVVESLLSPGWTAEAGGSSGILGGTEKAAIGEFVTPCPSPRGGQHDERMEIGRKIHAGDWGHTLFVPHIASITWTKRGRAVHHVPNGSRGWHFRLMTDGVID